MKKTDYPEILENIAIVMSHETTTKKEKKEGVLLALAKGDKEKQSALLEYINYSLNHVDEITSSLNLVQSDEDKIEQILFYFSGVESDNSKNIKNRYEYIKSLLVD